MKWPTLIWFALFVLIPLLIVICLSFATRGAYGGFTWDWTLDNYLRSFTWIHLEILVNSLKLALATTLTCAAVGTVMAWSMATASPAHRYFYVCAVAIPFLTNLVIRVYALKLFVGVGGPLQASLGILQIPFDPYVFTENSYLVFYGMVTTYLPFMVLPLYGAFEKFDFTLVEAAQDMGAGPWKILSSVMMPNLKKALFSGALLVFIPSLGEFVIPDLLGGAKTLLFGNLITEKFLKSRDWPLGSALSVVLILILLLVVALLQRRTKSSGVR
jgi:spermidine/putrescine transport system permease protein